MNFPEWACEELNLGPHAYQACAAAVLSACERQNACYTTIAGLLALLQAAMRRPGLLPRALPLRDPGAAATRPLRGW